MYLDCGFLDKYLVLARHFLSNVSMSSSRYLGYLVPSYKHQGSMDDLGTSVKETREHNLFL
jgi:hypothetical protein